MSITIPLVIPSSDWERFYRLVAQDGLRVVSRYKGVHIRKNGKSIVFTASCHTKTGGKTLGNFPLTKQGEEKAFDAYMAYVNSVPIEERTAWHNRKVPGKLMQKL